MYQSRSGQPGAESGQPMSDAIADLAWPRVTAKHIARDLRSSLRTARRIRSGEVPKAAARRESFADRLQHVLERRLAECVELERQIIALRTSAR